MCKGIWGNSAAAKVACIVLFALISFATPVVRAADPVLPAVDSNWTRAAASDWLLSLSFDPGSKPTVTSREAWGAHPFRGEREPMGVVEGVVLHHSVVIAGPKEIQRSHQDERGFQDIGYHYVVHQDDSGKWQIYEGRSEGLVGAHAGTLKQNGNQIRLNPGQIGIVIVGNFHPFSASNPGGFVKDGPEQFTQPEPGALYLVAALIQDLKDRHSGLKRLTAHGFGENAINPGSTLCPGEGQKHIVATLKRKFEL